MLIKRYHVSHVSRLCMRLCLGLSLVLCLIAPANAVETELQATETRQNNYVGHNYVGHNYVGHSDCIGCHQQQSLLWTDSPHSLSMQSATIDTVMGDFNDTVIQQADAHIRFYQQDGRFKINIMANSIQQDLTIDYVFGVTNVQHYLVKQPDGRLQVLDITWDNRPLSSGGKRWYIPNNIQSLTAAMIPARNWDSYCAECHSTNVKRNYKPLDNRFDTQWTAMNITCEACHGPGKNHQHWAKEINKEQSLSDLDDKGFTDTYVMGSSLKWQIDSETGKPVAIKQSEDSNEVNICARCHSRRESFHSQLSAQTYLDTFRPLFLTPQGYPDSESTQEQSDIYHDYLQSSKYQKGVVCSDCHEPHTTALRLPADRVCNQCHLSEKYRTYSHHYHPASAETTCLDCHMPVTTKVEKKQGKKVYHEHSFQVPAADNVTQLQSTMCQQCHTDKDEQWLVNGMKDWGIKRSKMVPFNSIREAQVQNLSQVSQQTIEFLKNNNHPAVARASILTRFRAFTEQDLQTLQSQLQDDSPMVRVAALISLENSLKTNQLDFTSVAEMILPMLDDPVSLVRMEVVRLLAALDDTQLDENTRNLYQKARQEYINSLSLYADRLESQVNLADFYYASNELESAEKTLRHVVKLYPGAVTGWIKLAHFYSKIERDTDAIQILTLASDRIAGQNRAEIYYARGLAQVRINELARALESLAMAVEIAPDNAQYSYVYAIALNSEERVDEALQLLQTSHIKHPQNRQILEALIAINQDTGHMQQALFYAEALLAIDRQDVSVKELVRQLKAQIQ